jgi:membrane protein implicated in regulation of membrane protease activity
VTEYAWDIVYVTWICLGVVGLLGEWAWWIGLVVPAYGGFLAYTTWCDVRRGVSMPPEVEREVAGGEGKSKRQVKMEQRGGQKVRYR